MTVTLWTLLLLWASMSHPVLCTIFTSKPPQSGDSSFHLHWPSVSTLLLSAPSSPACRLSLSATLSLSLSLWFWNLFFHSCRHIGHHTCHFISHLNSNSLQELLQLQSVSFYRSRQTRIGPCAHRRSDIFQKKHKNEETTCLNIGGFNSCELFEKCHERLIQPKWNPTSILIGLKQ